MPESSNSCTPPQAKNHFPIAGPTLCSLKLLVRRANSLDPFPGGPRSVSGIIAGRPGEMAEWLKAAVC
jgi:hypothetical protein